MLCSACGAYIEDNAAFCPACGARIDAADAAQEAPELFDGFKKDENNYESSDHAPVTGYPAEAAPDAQPVYRTAAAEDIAGAKKKLHGIYAAAALVLAVSAAVSAIFPYVGLPLAILTVLLSIVGRRTAYREMATVAMTIGLVMTLISACLLGLYIVIDARYGITFDDVIEFIRVFVCK